MLITERPTVTSLRDIATAKACTSPSAVVWEAPAEPREFVYTLQPPGGYVLEMVVNMDNIYESARLEGETEENLRTLRTNPALRAKPTRVEAVADGRGGVQIPYKFTLGRHYQDLDGVPAEAKRWFSRKHCSIFWKFEGLHLGEAMFSVADLSSNGTVLNGKSIGDKKEHPLADGDVIVVSTSSSGKPLLGRLFECAYLYSLQATGFGY